MSYLTAQNIVDAEVALTGALKEHHDARAAYQLAEDAIWFGCQDPKEIGPNEAVRAAYIRNECAAQFKRLQKAELDLAVERVHFKAVELIVEAEWGKG